MKKLISIVLALITAFSAFAVCGFAGEAQSLTLSVAQADLNSDDADRIVDWYKADGEYYLFIPAAINYDLACLKAVGTAQNISIDGEPYTEGKTLRQVLGDKTQITVTADGKDYKVNILNGSKTASVFIETESGSLDYIHEKKGNSESGNIEIVSGLGISVYDGKLSSIKGRGNSTWEMEKKPYNIKLDKKTDLFGMGKSKKWCLIANHGDSSLIRNVLAYEAAKRAGMFYTPQYEPVDLYINHEYMGSYLLMTKIEVDKNRINIQDLEEANEEANAGVDIESLSRGGVYGKYAGLLENTMKWVEIPNDPEDISGGYVLEMELANRYADEISGFVTSRSQPITMKSPEYASKAQMQYISDYYQKVEDAVFNDADMQTLGKLINIESLAQMYLLNEWCGNMDASLTSTYFYKPVNDVLYAGPAWDFDIAFGNNDSERFGNDYNDPTKWTVCYNRQYRNTVFGSWDVDEKPTLYNRVTKNSAFVEQAEKVWKGYMNAAVSDTVAYVKNIYITATEGSALANAVRWDIFGTRDISKIKTEYEAATAVALNYATTKANVISNGIGTVHDDAPETNAFVKVFKNILAGINDLFEKAVVLFKAENK